MISLFIYQIFFLLKSLTINGFINKPSITTLHCMLIILLPVNLFVFCRYIYFFIQIYIYDTLPTNNPLLMLLGFAAFIDLVILLTVIFPVIYTTIKTWYDKMDDEYNKNNKI